MTWGEFKTWMEEHGVKDSDYINWIDVAAGDTMFPPEIEDDDNGARYVSVS